MSMVNLFLPSLMEVRGFAHAVNVGLDRLRFLAPVVVGNRIRAVSEIVSAEEIKGAIQAVVRVTIEIEGEDGRPADKPACIADTVSRYFPECADAQRRTHDRSGQCLCRWLRTRAMPQPLLTLFADDATVEDPFGTPARARHKWTFSHSTSESMATGAKLELLGRAALLRAIWSRFPSR